MPGQRLTGRCLCGAVRYECGAPISPAAFCHCESCRRASGAHAVAWDRPGDGLPQYRTTRAAHEPFVPAQAQPPA